MTVNFAAASGTKIKSPDPSNPLSPTLVAVGGLEAGTDINGMAATDVLIKMLYPYQYPAFTSFAISGQATTLEIGNKVVGGVRDFTWATSNNSNIVADTVTIKDLSTGTVLASASANDGAESIDIGIDIVNSTPNASHAWRIEAKNTKDQTFSRDFRVYWRARVYVGNSTLDVLTESDVKALPNGLRSNVSGAFNFATATSSYFYIVYPDAWGDIGGWVDTDTGFAVDYTYTGTVNITNAFGVTMAYRLLRTTNQLSSNLNSNIS